MSIFVGSRARSITELQQEFTVSSDSNQSEADKIIEISTEIGHASIYVGKTNLWCRKLVAAGYFNTTELNGGWVVDHFLTLLIDVGHW